MTRNMTPEEVLRQVKEEDIKFIVLQFTDIMGSVKSATIPAKRLEEVLERGIWFDGSSVEGFARIYESDMLLVPDPSTFCILPWEPENMRKARLLCDVYTPDYKPFEGDPRYILKRALQKAKDMGYTYNVGAEIEFFLFKMNDFPKPQPVPHDVGGYFDFSPRDQAAVVRSEIISMLHIMGIDMEMDHHEVSPGQHEVDIRYSDALTAADNVITTKYVIRAVAQAHNLHASFMPKPIFGINGSGMHTHQSLFTLDGRNAFHDSDDKYKLSKLAYHFIAGQLENARALSAVVAPTVNSYKRLVPGYEAPVYICWGRINRSALIRVPAFPQGKENSTRIELRCPDPSCNPYLAFAVMLHAGLEGIEKGLWPPDPVEEDVYHFDDSRLKERYIRTLPGSLAEALDEMEKSELVKKALGEHTFKRFLEAKRKEWDDYRIRVTDWELHRYFFIL
ncbi:MAG: type I glutamate--ammonia ligase [Anaerolineae bacterium]|nr:type I glutamate--ammonia ligase [Anaerolineae bacterium]MDW8102191.1 type I glutamate--ammonia ligase [Anaerolineae bacterium]